MKNFVWVCMGNVGCALTLVLSAVLYRVSAAHTCRVEVSCLGSRHRQPVRELFPVQDSPQIIQLG